MEITRNRAPWALHFDMALLAELGDRAYVHMAIDLDPLCVRVGCQVCHEGGPLGHW